jgi:signal transduction histidine kinase
MGGPLDYRTLFLASAIVAAALLFFLAIQTRKPYPGFVRIVFAINILTAAVVTADLMGFVSDALWVIQITFLCALGFIDGGIRSFCDTPRRSSRPFIYVLAAILLQTFLFLTQTLYVRIIANSLLSIPIFIDAALPLLRDPPKGRRFSYRFMAAALMLGCVAACIRIVGVLSLEIKHSPYFSISPANTVFFCLIMFLLLALGFGMIALTNERLMAELNAAHERFAAESKERANAERQLARAERLAAVGRLGAGVAHFFNNRLCSIQLACSLIRTSLGKSGSPVVSYLDAIDEAVTSGANITRRVLQYAQAKSIWSSQINLLLLVEEVFPALRTTAGERVEVTTSNSCPIPPVKLDVDLLKESIFAIVQNARDAMPAGGKLAISLRTEELDPSRAKLLNLVPGSFVVLSFADTGSGMDDEVIRHVFEPFFTTKGLAKADGLGLASAFGFIRQSGGTITVSSTPHRGSTFELHLPIVPASGRYGQAETAQTNTLMPSTTNAPSET